MTVTHPEMTRYFMTIPEAASLVVQAGAIGGRGDVFVLDMGEPVRIIDLAMQMIRLSGKEPERDIDIEVVGSRPGEKLHEELWGEGEIAEPDPAPEDHARARPDRGHGLARRTSSPSSSGWCARARRSRSVSRLGDDDARAARVVGAADADTVSEQTLS